MNSRLILKSFHSVVVSPFARSLLMFILKYLNVTLMSALCKLICSGYILDCFLIYIFWALKVSTADMPPTSTKCI